MTGGNGAIGIGDANGGNGATGRGADRTGAATVSEDNMRCFGYIITRVMTNHMIPGTGGCVKVA